MYNSKKKYEKILVISILITFILFFFTEIQSQEANPKFNKTYTIGTNPFVNFSEGPNIFLEYDGLGVFGLYVRGQYCSVYDKEYKKKHGITLTDFHAAIGAKYYLNYEKKQHDSVYISLDLQGVVAFLQDKKNNKLTIYYFSPSSFVGWRWQWDTFFIDLAIGLGPSYVKFDRKSKIEKIDEDDYKQGRLQLKNMIIFGVAF